VALLIVSVFQYGRIIGVNIREDRNTGKAKGFAFVTFDEVESASRAIAAMNNYSYGGRTLTVSLASIRGSDAKTQVKKVIDDSWKTVPIPPRSKNGVQSAPAAGAAKPRATWDQWAGPVQKKAGSAPS
jgi:RNA recognition motif-containing protein